ncbi:MAG: replicative DNA helicase [Bacteroidota bacterium]|nr:replicative DNA helicase [Bacteroidota bacterium]
MKWTELGPEVRNELLTVGAVFMNKHVMDDFRSMLRPEMFLDTNLGFVFRAMTAVYDRGLIPDLQTVDTELFRLDEPLARRLGGLAFMKEGLYLIRDVENAMEYAKEVRRFYLLRCLHGVFEGLMLRSALTDGDVDSLIGEAEQGLMGVRTEFAGADCGVSVKEAGEASLQFYQELRLEGLSPMGYPTGLPELDDLMGGIRKRELILMAGRPGFGKTAMALNMAMACAQSGVPTLFVSMEMSDRELVNRLFPKVGDVSADGLRIYGPTLKELDEMERVNREVFTNLPLTLDYSESLSMEQLRGKVLRANKLGLCDVLFVDYLGMMRMEQQKGETLDTAIGRVAYGLKGLATKADIPVVCLVQMNRKVEGRAPSAPPMLSDLKDSGNQEAAADIVLFVHRPDKLLASAPKRVGEMHLAKCRNGATGVVEFRFNVSFSRIEV